MNSDLELTAEMIMNDRLRGREGPGARRSQQIHSCLPAQPDDADFGSKGLV